MLGVMLAPLFLILFHLQLPHFLHQLLLRMLYRLQHLNKEVSIVSRIPLLLLWPSPRSIATLCLIGLVRHGWPWFCLRWHGTHILHRLWSSRHNLREICLISLSFSQCPNEVANLNVVGLFMLLSFDPSCCITNSRSKVRELGLG